VIQSPTENGLDVFVKIIMRKKLTFFLFGADNEKFTSFTSVFTFLSTDHILNT